MWVIYEHLSMRPSTCTSVSMRWHITHLPLADEVLGEIRDNGQGEKEGHVLVGELGDEHYEHDELRDEEAHEGVAEDELKHLACWGGEGATIDRYIRVCDRWVD